MERGPIEGEIDGDVEIQIRPLTQADLPALLDLIDALADYESLPRPDAAARERLMHDALATPPRFWVRLAERNRRVVGYAFFFETYSTFLAQPTLYLEDIFILPEERGRGIGRAMMRALAQEALARGCGRMEWQVLTWNTPSIAFYEHLGARPLDDWRGYRLTADQIAAVAAAGGDEGRAISGPR